MLKKVIHTGLIALMIILMVGVNIQAERAIDKIKFPPLQEPEMPDIKTVSLENGLVLYLLEDHELPLINAGARFSAGEYLDPADKVGLASITGTVLRTGGTESMTGDEIDEALESIGATIEINMANTSGTAGMNILSEYVDTGLKVLADILRNPAFDEDKIELAKTQARSGIARRNDQPFQICIREFLKIIYGSDSPYARHSEYFTIDNISRDDLIAFHKECFSPENTMLAIWGDFDSDEMVEKIKDYFGDWPRGAGSVPPIPEVAYDFKAGVHYIEKKNVNQANILVGHIGGLLGDPDYFPMIVMNNILGSAFGNRLFNNVRSKMGLAYAVGGNFTSNIAYPGVYYNYCITKSESAVKAVRAMIDQIRGMQSDPPTADEMRLGKDGYLNSFVFNFEDKGDVINNIMEYDYYDFPRDFLFKAKSNVEKVTSQDVIDVAGRKLHPDAMHIVIVGNAEDFDEPLDVLGPVDTIDVTIPTGAPAEEMTYTPEAIARGKEMMSKASVACGGIENFKKINAITSKRTITIVTPQGEIPLQSSSSFILPDRERSDITTPMGIMTSVANGADSWSRQGPQIISATDEEIADNEREFFRNTILTFKRIEDGVGEIAHVGTEELDGKPVEIISIRSADGKNSYQMVLDPETFMPAGKKYFGKTLMGPANLTEVYSDYREISGVMIPFSIVILSDAGKVAEIAIEEFSVNPEIDEGIFSKPE